MNQIKEKPGSSGFSLSGLKFRAVKARKLGIALIIIVITTLVVESLPRFVPGMQLVENLLSDYRFSFLAPALETDRKIVIAAIDEDTLATFTHRSPIDRRFLINLLETLATFNVRAIGIDILFDQPTDAKTDDALQAVIAAYPVPVIIAVPGTNQLLTKEQLSFSARFHKGLVTGDANLIQDPADETVRKIYIHRPQISSGQLGFAAAIVNALEKEKVPPQKTLDLAYRQPRGRAPAFNSYPSHKIKPGIFPKAGCREKSSLLEPIFPLTRISQIA